MNRGSRFGLRWAADRLGSFNEAPIHESGKLTLPSLPNSVRIASMRPRFMNRGSHDQAHSERCWHTGFNEAPIHESGKFHDQGDSVDSLAASMRPRFMNRGSADLTFTLMKALKLQ